ncbi:response regulator transcription factor [Eubacterium sp. 1001713B170207_170306_E7]|uniref:response regulator transcription factor n=1 Tax=Eubacterium sp. 1001713B170207_170306_E7 TaxID=2787097 RepID=UPI00189C2487|nr:response regulator transcription factor [Eubacterium sp. 1001713B170207_170306_E7]
MTDKHSHTVLMVEDNEHVLALNQSVLQRKGYRVLTARSLAEAHSLLARKPQVDAAVLDIRLPDGDGLAFIPELRRATPAPVLMLTSSQDYESMVRGLTGGADDYMTKPYRIDELLARIDAMIIRRSAALSATEVVRGPLVLDTVAQRGFLFEQDMLLQPREFALLLFLIRSGEQSVSADALYEAVWKLPPAGSGGAVKTTVSRLRSKLRGSGYTITAVRGQGYQFGPEE